MTKHEVLIALVLSGCTVSRELADLVVAGSAPSVEPAGVPVFSRPVVPGEIESIVSAELDAEAAHI